jgi:hypothetical protein
LEAGLDVRFLNNRIGFDVAIYKRNTVNQIMAIPVAVSSGYSNAYMNIGNVENKGVELLVKGTPIHTKDLNWDLGWTFTKNNNKVLELIEGTDRVVLYGLSGGAGVWAEPGKPFAYFRGMGVQTWEGKTIVNAIGRPLAATEASELGNSHHDYTMGFNTSVTYKGFYFSAQFDFRKGGLFYSRTASINDFIGNNIRTTYNDRNPFIVPNSVMPNPLYDAITNPDVPQYVENTIAIDKAHYNEFWNYGGFSNNANLLIDRTSFRAREMVLGYRLPSQYLSKTPFSAVDISLVARNLFIWVPSSNMYIDPDITTIGNGVESQFGEFSGYPSTRSWGFSLKVSL